MPIVMIVLLSAAAGAALTAAWFLHRAGEPSAGGAPAVKAAIAPPAPSSRPASEPDAKAYDEFLKAKEDYRDAANVVQVYERKWREKVVGQWRSDNAFPAGADAFEKEAPKLVEDQGAFEAAFAKLGFGPGGQRIAIEDGHARALEELMWCTQAMKRTMKKIEGLSAL
jgi:hypothetical protein